MPALYFFFLRPDFFGADFFARVGALAFFAALLGFFGLLGQPFMNPSLP
jgi:hypothetical protein